MKSVVFDTNVYISGILFNGIPRKCLELAIEGKITAYISKEILTETKTVLSRKRFNIEQFKLQLILQEIESIATLIIPKEKIISACRDKKDHIILECALSAKATLIVTGDADLLVMNGYKDLKIINCKDFIELF